VAGAFDEGVAGGALALAFAALGNSALALTPVPARHRESAPAVAAGLTVALACLGAAGGVGLVRLATRRPGPPPAGDHAGAPAPDPPDSAGGLVTPHPR
jgi:hypothetical protein